MYCSVRVWLVMSWWIWVSRAASFCVNVLRCACTRVQTVVGEHRLTRSVPRSHAHDATRTMPRTNASVAPPCLAM